MADTKLTALTEVSVPATDDLIYWVDDPAGTPVSNKASANRVGGLLSRAVCNGRLTTESGVPVSTSDRTAQGTIYFTPYNGNLLTVYDGTRWKLYTFSELSLALTATSGKNYDVFVYDNAGTLTLELSAAWTDDTTRADALTLQDGIYVKSGATTRRWLGTIRASAANQTTDAADIRLVSNYYNAVPRPWSLIDTTDSWTYNSTTLRQANGVSGLSNCLQGVFCSTDRAVDMLLQIVANFPASAVQGGIVGIGVDSVSAITQNSYLANGAQALGLTFVARYTAVSLLGFHYYAWLEQCTTTNGAITFYGDNAGGTDGFRGGFRGVFWG